MINYWHVIEHDPPPEDSIVIARDDYGLVLSGYVSHDGDGYNVTCPISDYVLSDVHYWMIHPPVPERNNDTP